LHPTLTTSSPSFGRPENGAGFFVSDERDDVQLTHQGNCHWDDETGTWQLQVMITYRGDAPVAALDERDALPHPLQPLGKDFNGILRFKGNKIIEWLHDKGNIDLNQIATVDFPDEDRMQLAQLIGYSLSGYGDLSYVTDENWQRARASYVDDGDPPTAFDTNDV
jgi:hypothetical protein